MVPEDFTARYTALSKPRQRLLRRECRRWDCWGKTTFYSKLSGENLTLMETTMLHALFDALERTDGEQLEIMFLWDVKNGPILEQ